MPDQHIKTEIVVVLELFFFVRTQKCSIHVSVKQLEVTNFLKVRVEARLIPLLVITKKTNSGDI